MSATTSLRSTVRVQAGLIERLRENITDLKGKLKKAAQDKEVLQKFFRDEILNSAKLKKQSTREFEPSGAEGRTPRFPRRASVPDFTLTSFDVSFSSNVSILDINEQLALLVRRFGSVQERLIHFSMKHKEAPIPKYSQILSSLETEKQLIESELYRLSKSLN